MKKSLFLVVFGAGSLVLGGCRKEDDLIVCDATTPTPTLTLQEFGRRNAAPVQVFALADLNQTQTVRTGAGATVQVRARTLRKLNGDTASGAAQLRLRELRTPADFITADLPSVGAASAPAGALATRPGGAPLQSGGVFQLQVWRGSTRLVSDMRPNVGGMLLTAPQLARVVQALSLNGLSWWSRSYSAPFAAGQADSAGWLPRRSRLDTVTVSQGVYRAYFRLDSVSWYSFVQVWQDLPSVTARHTVQVTVPAGGLARVYLVPTQGNGVFRAQPRTATAWALDNVPAGAELTVVVLQEQAGGNLRFGTQRVTSAAGAAVVPVLEELPEAEIVRRLRLL